jgi:hypothetical protein
MGHSAGPEEETAEATQEPDDAAASQMRELQRVAEQTSPGEGDSTPDQDSASDEPTKDRSPESDTPPRSTDSMPSIDQIPYILRRKKVNEGREQKPFFIRPDVYHEDQLIDELTAMIGEQPPKSDVREAAMVAAQRNPELLAGVLREWGYDLD